MKNFREISVTDMKENFVDMIANGWMLITAGDASACNTMTASWGGVGEMWNSHVAFVVIRQSRHTKKFADSNDRMTLSFFDEQHRKALVYCGSRSGRDEPKIKNAGLTEMFTPAGTPCIAEARLVMEIRKLYVDSFSPEKFADKALAQKIYEGVDFHDLYICAIENVYERE